MVKRKNIIKFWFGKKMLRSKAHWAKTALKSVQWAGASQKKIAKNRQKIQNKSIDLRSKSFSCPVRGQQVKKIGWQIYPSENKLAKNKLLQKGVKYIFTPVILPLSMCRLLTAALLRLNSGAGNWVSSLTMTNICQ